MNQIIKNTIILFVITLVAGFCLGAVHDVTLEPIAQAQQLPKHFRKYIRRQQALTHLRN